MVEVRDFDAIILAGGRGSRLGGVDKAALHVGGLRLIDRATAAVTEAGAKRIVVVGPERSGLAATHVVRESPALSGPLAAALAGLEYVTAPRVMLLACDLVNPTEICALLIAESRERRAETSVLLRDGEGHPQWLAGIHETSALRLAATDIVTAQHEPLKRLFTASTIRFVDAASALTRDIDRPEDLSWARDQVDHP